MGSSSGSDTIRRIRQSIGPSLSVLLDRYRREEDEWSRRQLEEEYLRLVDGVLRVITSWQQYRLYYLGTTQEDLMQWARIAAIESIKRYDDSRGTDFLAYLISFVRRYVYNKMLDELPVPRAVSKQIRSYTAQGISIAELPSPLYNAAMLRCPIPVESCMLEDKCFSSPEEQIEDSDDEIAAYVQSLIDFIGEKQWERLCCYLARLPSSRRRLLALLDRISKLTAPPHIQPLMDNLINYLRRQANVEVHHP